MVKFSSVHGEQDPWVRITGWVGTGKLQIVGVLVLTFPVRVAMRLSGRRTQQFEATF